MFSRQAGFPALFFLGMSPLVLVLLAEALTSGGVFFPATARSIAFFILLSAGVAAAAFLLSRRQEVEASAEEEEILPEPALGPGVTPIIYSSKKRYQALSDATFEAIFLSDKGVCLDQNLTAEKMFGYTLGEALGRLGTEWIVPEDRERVMQNMMAGRTAPYRVHGLRKDGSTFPCEIQGRMFEQGGRMLRVTALRDITARVEAEQERDRSNLQVQEAQRQESLVTLAGGVAQDFNHLMQMVQGHLDQVWEEVRGETPGFSSEQAHKLDAVRSAARQAARLAGQLQMYAGKTEPATEELQLQSLLHELEPLLRAALPRKVRLDLRAQHGLPALFGDRTQISQVVLALVTNAAEALEGPEGTISLETGVKLCDEDFVNDHSAGTVSDSRKQPLPGEFVFLEVADTGCGMPPETVARVFDPFFSTKAEGRGLGMAALAGIMRGHRGLVQVQSKPDIGSSFRVFFPVSGDQRQG